MCRTPAALLALLYSCFCLCVSLDFAVGNGIHKHALMGSVNSFGAYFPLAIVFDLVKELLGVIPFAFHVLTFL